MNNEKLVTLCLEIPWALPACSIRRAMERSGLEPTWTFEEAQSKLIKKIGCLSPETRRWYARDLKQAAKQLPQLSHSAQQLEEYDGPENLPDPDLDRLYLEVLKLNQIEPIIEKIYQRICNFERPPKVTYEVKNLIYGYRNFEQQKEHMAQKVDFIKKSRLLQVVKPNGSIDGYEYPRIISGNKNLPRITDESWRAIKKRNDRTPCLFNSKGHIVGLRIIDGNPTIKHLNKYDVRHVLLASADFFKLKRENKDLESKAEAGEPISIIAQIPDFPSFDVVENLNATPSKPLPKLINIKKTPYYDSESNLIHKPGYNDKTGCYLYDRNNICATKPKLPTVTEAKLLFDELFTDIPFVNGSDYAHTMALLLQRIVRQLINGPTPLFVVKSPRARTGKTLLTHVVTHIATGQKVEMQAMSKDDAEVGKCIIAKLLTMPDFFVFDNVSTVVDSPSLSMAITAPIYEGRILSKSKMVSLPVNCTWIITGNNVRFSSEIAQRSVQIHLDTGLERPEQRRNFHQPDLMNFVKFKWNDFFWSAIALVENWKKSGRYLFKKRKIAGFESFCRITGGILEAAEIDGFLENQDSFYDAATDDETKFMNKLVYLWQEKFNGQRVMAKDLTSLDIQIKNPRMLAAIIGNYIDRRIGDFTIRRGKKRQDIYTYYLEENERSTIQ